MVSLVGLIMTTETHSQSENWARTGSEINFEREDKTGTRKKKVSVHR